VVGAEDAAAAEGGISKIILKGSDTNKSKALVKVTQNHPATFLKRP
jgi:hypothetical protein